jgi:hypothetical protein
MCQAISGSVRLELVLLDASRLIVREMLFYDTGRAKYSYQWMSSANELIHRWAMPTLCR